MPGARTPGPQPSPLTVGFLLGWALSQARCVAGLGSGSACTTSTSRHCTLSTWGEVGQDAGALAAWPGGLSGSWPRVLQTSLWWSLPHQIVGGKPFAPGGWEGPQLGVIQFRSGFSAGLGPAELPAASASVLGSNSGGCCTSICKLGRWGGGRVSGTIPRSQCCLAHCPPYLDWQT